MKPERKLTALEIYALAFGLFLGLCIWKFGNPVILDSKIDPPSTPAEFWLFAWPTHWANWFLFPLAVAGAILVVAKQSLWPGPKWLWLPPLLWLGWQFFSAAHSEYRDLSATTLWQFAGCVACYFLGAFLFGGRRATACLLIGLLTAFTFCLIRAVDQRVVEFPQSRQLMLEGERTGWTNIPPDTLLELKREHAIITTNGVDVPNPSFLGKVTKGRVYGTLVYPNALAGLILLLWPVSLSLVFGAKNLRPKVRAAAVVTALFLGGMAFFWSGSKLGWLIGMAIGGLYLLRLKWPVRLKLAAIAAVAVLGLGIFAARFHGYFAAGATSVGARLDYWRVAVQTTENNPLFGTGPGTFQRPYAQFKPPDAEMARLAHNDYLEQFSDSGIPGGILYLAWIALALVSIGRKTWKSEIHTGGPQALRFAILAGLLGWFTQGIGEFSLYIPALAWTAFTLLGWLFATVGNQFDNKPPGG
jgi:O-antigen ligase